MTRARTLAIRLTLVMATATAVLGTTGGAVFAAVEAVRDPERYTFMLNPGHHLALDEHAGGRSHEARRDAAVCRQHPVDPDVDLGPPRGDREPQQRANVGGISGKRQLKKLFVRQPVLLRHQSVRTGLCDVPRHPAHL